MDVHQSVVVVCLLVGAADEKPRKEVRTFSTFTGDLLKLREWLLSEGVTHIGMESSGVYWKPVNTVLEEDFEIIIGNAQHIKNVPGRKTDVKDAEWIAELVRHGLIARSFVPPKPIRELRGLLRYRRKVVEARTAERNRLLKLLDTANIKLASVVCDVFGVSGMLMLKAIVRADSSPKEMAQLAKRRLRSKLALLQCALEGKVEEHHRFLLRVQLRRLEQAEQDLKQLDRRIDTKLKPYAEVHERLMEIPGVKRVLAAVIIAEIGVDMSVFLSASHLASWAGVSPGNHESAGNRKSGRIGKGNVYLKTALVEAANAAARQKGSYLKDKFYRLKARRGYKRALMAIAHKILVAAYHMLSTGEHYRELGDAYLDQIYKKRIKGNLIRRLQRLGYEVQIKETAA